MPAVAVQERKVFRLDPCPAEERVCDFYDVPDAYHVGANRAIEGYDHGDDGIIRQKCGGGRRIIKKKLSY